MLLFPPKLIAEAKKPPDRQSVLAARRVMIKRFMRVSGTTDPRSLHGIFPDDWIALFP